MSSPALVHEHDKVAIGVRAGKSAGGPRRQLRVMAKPATTAPKKNKVPFDYAHSRGR